MPMGDGQFAELTAKVGCKKEGMSHLDVAAELKGSEELSAHPAGPVSPPSALRVSEPCHQGCWG